MFKRALPSDPLTEDSEGAWHSCGPLATQKRLEQKHKIDIAIKAALTLGLPDKVEEAIGCKYYEAYTAGGAPDVGALLPDDRENPTVCGGLICGPFYHGSVEQEDLPICFQCYHLESEARHLCKCCSWDDGSLAKGFTCCLQGYCPALGRKNDGEKNWHRAYYDKSEWYTSEFMYQCTNPPTREQRLTYLSRYN